MDNYGFEKMTYTKPRKAPPKPARGAPKPLREKAKSWQRVDKRAAWN